MFRQGLKFLLAIALSLVITGCTCRSKAAAGPDDEHLPDPSASSPLKDINFAFDSYALDANAKNILSRNAEWLKANADRKVEVEGHCDERGTNEYNMALGAKRAQSAFDYLVSLGIERNRMSTVSYGEELPLDPAHNEDAWAKNRRAHFNVK